MRDRVAFIECLRRQVLFSVLGQAFQEITGFFQGRLALEWHIGVTRAIHERYFANQTFFHLGRANLKDADQRIAVDAEETLNTVASLAHNFVTVTSLGTYFTSAVYQEMGTLAALGPWLFLYTGRKLTNLVPLDWRRLAGTMEFTFSQYRQQHTRLVQHGEAVAALQGANREGSRLKSLLHDTERTQRFFWDALMSFIWANSFAFGFGAQAFSPIAVLMPLLNRTGDTVKTMEAVTYQVSIFQEAMTSTGTLASSLQDLQRVGGNSKRVTDLLSAIEKVEDMQAATDSAFKQGINSIEFDGVQVVTPTGHTLVENLTFSVHKGSNLMITGHNGAGKSSIFRCLGGLWKIPKGTITKPGSGAGLHGEVFYIPQKPYNLVGTLVEQVTYPDCGAKLDKAELEKLLNLVDLGYLSEREGEIDWERALSLGEQQRLAMVRVFFHNPSFAILDECTSGVSAEMERRFYTKCGERSITCITISHRPALQHFHDRMLALDGKKGFHIENVVRTKQAEVRQAAITGAGAITSTPKQEVKTVSVTGRIGQVLRLYRVAWPQNFGMKLVRSIVIASLRTTIGNSYSIFMAGLYLNLLNRNGAGFRKHAFGLCLWSVIAPLFEAIKRWNQCHLGTDLRMELSKNLLDRYLEKSAFHRLKNSLGNKNAPYVPDPESRLSNDIREWGLHASSCVSTLPTLVADGLWYGIALSQVAGAKAAVSIYVYAAAASFLMRTVMPSFATIKQEQKAIEAKYRSEHASVLASAESIAFFGGGTFEREVVERRFRESMDLKCSTLAKTLRYKLVEKLLLKEVPNNASYVMQDQMIGQDSVGTLQGATLGAAQQRIIASIKRMFEALTTLQEYFEILANLSGSTSRLHDLLEALEALPSAGEGTYPSDDVWFNGVDLKTPAGVCLVKDLEVYVKRGESLMVTGPNGCGKSSLFRALGGLWTVPGAIRRPVRGLDVFLVPQKPFLTSPGTLADQVTYPEKVELTDEVKAQLRVHMVAVGLEDFLEREGWEVQAKDDVLSLGEQQRLGMARLFFHKPAFAVLDECTSAVSADVEERMYAHAHSLQITTITLSQRLALSAFHVRELQIGLADASWSLQDIEK
eukprot:gnl/TRDRNA2_/TRDRNA2_168248_c0_seq1.p1 gnl/TRDRNA2_/TRDRNA2_168248_c0~~gnl/TRDRNA2_/TRDRNA2_168248_c0_seq1.p1  ORF type:complete len:1097 (-),score=223.69 gnl/TRDRNA2_/TRDRNA2_168248_c0_seq1:98-3388(-)